MKNIFKLLFMEMMKRYIVYAGSYVGRFDFAKVNFC